MKNKQIFALGAAAGLALSGSSLYAADAEVKGEIDLPKSERRIGADVDVDRDTKGETRADREYARESDRAKVRNTDKASGIIGMEVRNNDNQKLGEIKDLVMDFNSGKISYAVLAVGGFLGIGEKLIALPPNALKVDERGGYLLLDADKSKVQAAPGFAATAWPAPGDPEINRFWSDVRGTGAPARGETSRVRGDIDVDVDRDKKLKGEVKTDSDRKKLYTEPDKDRKIEVDVDKD